MNIEVMLWVTLAMAAFGAWVVAIVMLIAAASDAEWEDKMLRCWLYVGAIILVVAFGIGVIAGVITNLEDEAQTVEVQYAE